MASTVARKSDAPLEAIPILPLAFSEFRIFWIKVLFVGYLEPIAAGAPSPRKMYNFVEGYRVQVYRPQSGQNLSRSLPNVDPLLSRGMLVVARPSLNFGLAGLALLLLKKAETFLHLGTLYLCTEFLRRGVEVPPNCVRRRVFLRLTPCQNWTGAHDPRNDPFVFPFG